MPRERGFLAILALWTLLCALFGARGLLDLDSVPLLLALEHQDLRLHQPQPPGFILHVWPAQLLHACGMDGFVALRLVSWLALAAAALFLVRAVRLVHGATTARWAAALFLSSPLVLFHGMTAGTFGDEALVGSLTLFLCMRALARQDRGMRFEAYLLGLLGGLRPTTLVFSLPVLLWTLKKRQCPGRSRAAAGLAWFLGMLCWLVPQADLAGGFDDYVAVNAALLQPLWHASPVVQGPLSLLRSLGTPLSALVLGLGMLRLLASAFAAPKAGTGLDRSLVFVWVVPVAALGLLLGFRHSGAMLGLWPLLCMALATGWTQAMAQHRWHRLLLPAVLALDVALFFWIATPDTPSPGESLQTAARRNSGDAAAAAAETQDGARPDATAASRATAWGPAALLLQRVDFFHDRVRQAPFAALLHALESLPFPEEETLLLGGEATRAACVRFAARPILQADALRPVPFLLYENLHPTRVDSSFVVPSHVGWLLLEGEPAQLDVAPPTSEAQRPVRPIRLRRDLHAFPIGRQRFDAWFTPRAAATGPAPPRLHLWREGLLDDPSLFERTSRTR